MYFLTLGVIFYNKERENYMGHFVVKEHYMKLKKIILYYFMIIGMIIGNIKLHYSLFIIFLMIIMRVFLGEVKIGILT